MRATREKYDVLIVGGGPAGSSCAIRLAQRGLNVMLVEKKRFPRQKLCGEFISPECLTHFDELGILDELSIDAADIERTVFYARNGRSLAVPSEWFADGSHALGLSRAQMDYRLLERARMVGAEVLEDTQAVGVIFENEKVVGVRLKREGETTEIRARIVIDATGRSRMLMREVEKISGAVRGKRASYVAFKAHLDGAGVNDGDCEIYAYRGGYGGCIRVEKGVHNLCFIVSADLARKFGGDAGEMMERIVCKNARARRSLENARVVGPWLAVPIEKYGRGQLAPADGLLAVGDAAAFIDPFTGSGILIALECGNIASEVIADAFAKENWSFEDLAREYRTRYAAAFERRLRVSSWIRRAAFVPFLAETVIKSLALSRGVTRLLARATRPAPSGSSFPQG